MEECWERVVEGLGMVRRNWGRFTDHISKKVCQMDGRTWEGLEVLLHLITYTSINQENEYFSFTSNLISEECL